MARMQIEAESLLPVLERLEKTWGRQNTGHSYMLKAADIHC